MQNMAPDRSEWSDAQQHLWELQDRIHRKLEIMDEKQTAALDKLEARLTGTLKDQDERLSAALKTQDDRIVKLIDDVSGVKVRSSIWGGLSGGLMTLVSVAVDYFRKHS